MGGRGDHCGDVPPGGCPLPPPPAGPEPSPSVQGTPTTGSRRPCPCRPSPTVERTWRCSRAARRRTWCAACRSSTSWRARHGLRCLPGALHVLRAERCRGPGALWGSVAGPAGRGAAAAAAGDRVALTAPGPPPPGAHSSCDPNRGSAAPMSKASRSRTPLRPLGSDLYLFAINEPQLVWR